MRKSWNYRRTFSKMSLYLTKFGFDTAGTSPSKLESKVCSSADFGMEIRDVRVLHCRPVQDDCYVAESSRRVRAQSSQKNAYLVTVSSLYQRNESTVLEAQNKCYLVTFWNGSITVLNNICLRMTGSCRAIMVPRKYNSRTNCPKKMRR